MNGINAPKVIECFGSDGNKYRQLAKSGNDDLRQDAVRSSLSFLIMRFLQIVFVINILKAWATNYKKCSSTFYPFSPNKTF